MAFDTVLFWSLSNPRHQNLVYKSLELGPAGVVFSMNLVEDANKPTIWKFQSALWFSLLVMAIAVNLFHFFLHFLDKFFDNYW